MGNKKSKIWLISSENFIGIFHASSTLTDMLHKFGLENKGSNYKTLKNRLREEGLDYSRFTHNAKQKIKNNNYKRAKPLNQILVKNSNYTNISCLKKRLIREHLLEYKCYECNCGNLWNNKTLVLQLDHVNGDAKDHRLENLRLLCPNCHSQTKNFAGKNIIIARDNKVYHNFCKLCRSIIQKRSQVCSKCRAILRRKCIRPDSMELAKLVEILPFTQIAKKYEVSCNTIRKWVKYYGIQKK